MLMNASNGYGSKNFVCVCVCVDVYNVGSEEKGWK